MNPIPPPSLSNTNDIHPPIPPSSSSTSTQDIQSLTETARENLKSIFSSTTCYDLMQVSSKGLVFETTIPFQLAFFALIEHDTDVASLWDPEYRKFIGLMTLEDYITALRICAIRGLDPMELTTKTMHDMLISAPFLFKNNGFYAIDAEDSIISLCELLINKNREFVPIIDSETGSLVSILSPCDVLHLLDQISKLNEEYFSLPLNKLHIGTYNNLYIEETTTHINEILENLNKKNLSSCPIIDKTTKKIIGLYHKSNISFIIKASDPNQMITNLKTFKAYDSIIFNEELYHNGDLLSSSQGLIIVKHDELLSEIIRKMLLQRSYRAIIIDPSLGSGPSSAPESDQIIAIISFKDIIKFFINELKN